MEHFSFYSSTLESFSRSALQLNKPWKLKIVTRFFPSSKLILTTLELGIYERQVAYLCFSKLIYSPLKIEILGNDLEMFAVKKYTFGYFYVVFQIVLFSALLSMLLFGIFLLSLSKVVSTIWCIICMDTLSTWWEREISGAAWLWMN